MNARNNFLRYLAVAAAVLAAFVVFGVSGAQAASTHAVAASGSLVAEEHDEGDEEPSDEPTDSEDEDSDDEDSDDEDNESDESTDEPTDEPTFSDPTFNDPTDDVTEMPTDGVENTSGASASPLGWILLAGGVLCAAAAVFIYRRNRHIM